MKVSTKGARRLARGQKFDGRQGKYNAGGRHVNGIWCASEAEALRFEQLLRLEVDGVIEQIENQPEFSIVINGKHIARYRADFRYFVVDDRGRRIRSVIEDVKGMVTDVYVMKKRLVEALHQVQIIEIPARKVPEWEGRTP